MTTTVTDTPSVEIEKLGRDLRAIGGGVARHLNREFKTAAGPVAREAASNAGWSTRIPGAIKVRASRSRVFPGADIVVAGLPHPRLYEGIVSGSGKAFRHKVFARSGRPAVWTSQATRPFIRPAVWRNRKGFAAAADSAVRTVARENGFT